MTTIDKEAVITAYEEVRDDNNETNWFTLKFNEKAIEMDTSGVEYDDFLARLSDDERIFAYVRVTTGDELSKRAKFALITWVGANVSPMKKAKLSVDKSLVKQHIKNFAIEILATETGDVKYDTVRTALIKAGGAAYGTGAS